MLDEAIEYLKQLQLQVQVCGPLLRTGSLIYKSFHFAFLGFSSHLVELLLPVFLL